ncbi:MAG: hypothetical protein ACLPSF_11630 [Methylocella sp.]
MADHGEHDAVRRFGALWNEWRAASFLLVSPRNGFDLAQARAGREALRLGGSGNLYQCNAAAGTYIRWMDVQAAAQAS